MKKLVFCFLAFFCFLGICNADIKTYDRNSLKNYGVNKKWSVNPSNLNNVLNTYAVDADDKIYDFADILSSSDEYSLKNLIDNFTKTTGFELVILTDSFYNTTDDENGNYAQDFYDYNDFAIDDEYYSGVIIFRNNYEGAKYYGVYSFGEAQYYYYTDGYSRLDNTLDYVYSDMVAGNYNLAMSEIISDLLIYYQEGKEDGMEDYYLDKDGMLVYDPKFSPPIIIALIFSVVITWVVVATNLKKNKMVYRERFAHDYLDYRSIKYTNKQDIKYDSRTTSYTVSSSSGGGGGGGRSFSSSRGSSGGGRSGGGRRG